jgi:oligoendopeptidase F
MTGSATCEEVVKQTLGEDLTRPEFWATAVKAMEPSLIAYEAIK